MLAAAGTFVLGTPTLVTAQALVEDVRGKVSGIEFMDYVSRGSTIELGSQGSVVLGYLKSCIRETIVGGVVTVGLHESRVHNGNVERTKVACDAGRITLTDKEANQSAATSFRSAVVAEAANRNIDEPAIVIYSLSPVFQTHAPGKLVITRLDAPGPRREIMITSQSLTRGKFYDLDKTKTSLAPGNYVASLGPSKTYFKIDPTAQPGATPIIGRLVRLQ